MKAVLKMKLKVFPLIPKVFIHIAFLYFLDTPVEDLPPLGDEDFLEDDDSSSSEASEPSRDSQK